MAESTVEALSGVNVDLTEKTSMRVLHVDDEAGFLKTAKQILEMQGAFQVETALSVEDAMKKMEEKTYDAIVCDYVMPGKDGLEFLKELRDGGNNVPFIIFTGKGREEVAIKALNLGADQYINKVGHPETVYYELAHGIRKSVERKRAVIEVWRRKERLRAILASSPDAIIISDLNANVIDCNQATLKLTGYTSKEEIVGKNSLDFIAEKDRNRALENLKKTLEQGTVNSIEYTLLKKNGEEYQGELSASVIKDSSGNAIGFVGVVRDITERKKRGEALRASEEKLRNIFQSANDCIFYVDKSGRIIDVNRKAVQLFGRSRKELLGRHFAKVGGISPQNLPKVMKAFAQSLVDKQRTLSVCIKDKSGQGIPLECLSSLVKADGKITGVLVIARDVTERKKAEEALRESEESYRLLLENVPAYIMTLDKDGIIRYVNRTRFIRQKDVIGKQTVDFFKPEYRHQQREAVRRAFETGEISVTEVATVFDQFLIQTLVPLKHKEEVVEVMIVAQDITKRKKAEEALRESEEKFRAMGTFAKDAIILVDNEGVISYWNPAAERMLGYTKQEAIGKEIHRFLIPDRFQEKHMKGFAEFKRTGKGAIIGKTFESKAIRKDGTEFPIELSLSKLRKKGKWHAMSIIRDITERKKAEEALAESEERYRNLVENSMDGIAVVQGSEVKFVNRRMLGMFGCDIEDCIVGHNFTDFVSPEYRTLMEERGAAREKGDDVPSRYEFKALRKDGSEFVAELSVSRIVYEGKVARQGVLRDITESKKAEERYRELTESISDVFFAMDKDFRYTYWNKASERLTGISAKNAIGKSLTEVFPDVKGTKVEQFYLNVLRTKQHGTFVNKYRVGDKDFVFEIDAYPTKEGLSVFVKDITQRKDMEASLQESEEKYRDIVQMSPDPIVTINLKGVITSANPSTLRLMGYSEDEIVGKHFTKLGTMRARDVPRFMKLFGSVIRGKVPKPFEAMWRTKDGAIYFTEVHLSLMKKEGKVIGIQAIARDITERKKTEEALSRSEVKFKEIFESAIDAIVYLDSFGRILDVNRKAVELFGGSKEELLGKHFTKIGLFTLKDIPTLMRNFAQVLKDKEAILNVTIKNKNGQEFPLECLASVIKADGKSTITVVARDITERRRAEEELKKTLEKVQILNEKLSVVGELTRHDVRNKLSTVTNNAYLAKQRLTDDPKALEHINQIESSCKQVERIFEFARIYEKLGMEELVNMNLDKSLKEAASLFSDLHGIEVINDCQGLTALADSLLRQLFYNLIDNSLKHGEKVSQIRVHCERGKDKLRLVYEDDGVGIPKAEKEKIFQESYGKGTGYGLYLVRKMCEVYGWTIKETGKHGKGAQFTMTIPKTPTK